MRLEATAPRRRRASLTPLIDVIFLLLLFFMLSSTFSKFGEIELTGATASGVAEQPAPIYLRLRGDEIAVNGTPVTLETLGAALQAQAASGSNLVLVAMDDAISSQHFVDVYAVARGVGGLGVAIVRSGAR